VAAARTAADAVVVRPPSFLRLAALCVARTFRSWEETRACERVSERSNEKAGERGRPASSPETTTTAAAAAAVVLELAARMNERRESPGGGL